jgi:hypothetical protein
VRLKNIANGALFRLSYNQAAGTQSPTPGWSRHLTPFRCLKQELAIAGSKPAGFRTVAFRGVSLRSKWPPSPLAHRSQHGVAATKNDAIWAKNFHPNDT